MPCESAYDATSPTTDMSGQRTQTMAIRPTSKLRLAQYLEASIRTHGPNGKHTGYTTYEASG
jgi:hypothetical protein